MRIVWYFRLAITPLPIPNAEGVTPPCHQVSTLRPQNFCIWRFAATSGPVSCLNQTRLPLPSVIIGPPGPTGWISIVLWLSGWTMGEGRGVRNTRPRVPPTSLLMSMRGGRRSGCETKCWSFSGCCFLRLSTGCTGPRRAIVNVRRTGLRCRIRTTSLTRSPCANGRSGMKLAPREPE